MARSNSRRGKTQEYVIPEAHKAFIKLDPDGVHVIRTMRVPRFETVLVRKSVERVVDHAQVTPEQGKVNYHYGTGRKCRDGAETKDAKGKTLNAKTEAGKKALLENALAHCDARIETMYGIREPRASQSGVSTVTRECRKLLIQFACKNLTKGNKKYTAKSLPSSLITAKSVEAAKAVAKEIGVPTKKLNALIKRGEAIAALIDDDTDMSI